MADYESLLERWQRAGLVDAEIVRRIRAYEAEEQQPAGLRWQGIVALILGGILLACGVVLFVCAHWDKIGPGGRYALVMAMVAVFHLGGGWAREQYRGLSTALHAVGTVSTGAAIALVGQIFNIQEHWPAAILLWAVAALAGWILLQEEAQQILVFLLFPAWMLSELSFYAQGHIGSEVYIGRFLFVWAVLYLTVFLGSRHKVAQGVLFAIAAVAAVVGVVLMIVRFGSWHSSDLSLRLRLCYWLTIAALPLLLSLFRLFKSMAPVACAALLALLLPWCAMDAARGSFDMSINLLSQALVAAFCVFLIWWGVRLASKALVNLGIVGFAGTVAWFYFSDVFDKVGRSLGLIGLGVLFLAGGWALEKTRRGLVARMEKNDLSLKEAL